MVTLDLDITGTTNQSDDQTRFLVLGDTHVGYRHRSKSKKSKWADSADDLVEFRRALSLARDLQVDAVVHAGDVFDHQNTQKDRSAVTDEIDLLITGHLHVADQPRIRGHDIPVLVTGPTVPISSYEGDINPSTWLLTATDSGIDLERQPV